MLQTRTNAQISRAAIERLYIAMRHLLVRGHYKPLGRSGKAMLESMHELNPEIYGRMRHPNQVELDGLLYIFQRLPQGIESCTYIHLTGSEGLDQSGFPPIIPSKRRRHCYRIDEEQMYIEMTRGRSDVYDLLTHLTFMFNEGRKIGKNALNENKEPNRTWLQLSDLLLHRKEKPDSEFPKELATTYLSAILHRTYEETLESVLRFEQANKVNDLFEIIHGIGRLYLNEFLTQQDIEISFSSTLREQIGHHIYGERWATHIKDVILQNQLETLPMHIISANMHSVMNWFYAQAALADQQLPFDELLNLLSKPENGALRDQVNTFALEHGMIEIPDTSATNIGVQLFDSRKIAYNTLPENLKKWFDHIPECLILVMDYAFGQQAYETMDELLKPYEIQMDQELTKKPLNVSSVNIMGKAGILEGKKGDIMIPNAHVFEGSADNYPFYNDLRADMFGAYGLNSYAGPMITVLGTSLQNKDVLRYFLKSSWKAIGLEMEGAHYQKAIQSASLIRKSVDPKITIRYAYYASDNPLESGSTLASGSLGIDGILPTYAITLEILKGIILD